MTTNGGSPLWRRIQPPLGFVVGIVILWHEVAIHKGGERPYILLAALALCGIASLLKADQILRNLGLNVTIGRPQEHNRSESHPPKEGGAGP